MLRALSPRVRALAREHDLPYHEESFWGASRKLYLALKKTAAEAEALDGAALDAAMFDQRLVDALSLQG